MEPCGLQKSELVSVSNHSKRAVSAHGRNMQFRMEKRDQETVPINVLVINVLLKV